MSRVGLLFLHAQSDFLCMFLSTLCQLGLPHIWNVELYTSRIHTHLRIVPSDDTYRKLHQKCIARSYQTLQSFHCKHNHVLCLLHDCSMPKQPPPESPTDPSHTKWFYMFNFVCTRVIKTNMCSRRWCEILSPNQIWPDMTKILRLLQTHKARLINLCWFPASPFSCEFL